MNKPLMILISGPYISGTNGDESAIAKNLKAMEDYALPIFSKGHLAVVGEWLAWPVIRQAGGNSHSSDQKREFRLIGRLFFNIKVTASSHLSM